MSVPEADLRADSPVSDRPAAAPARDTGPLLAVLMGRGPDDGRHDVRRPAIRIGRGGDNDLILADPSVSEHHARLRLDAGVWTVGDLGSVNGTWVDGEPVQGDVPIASGSSLRLGTIELVFAAHDRWEDSPPAVERPGYVLGVSESRAVPVPLLVGAAILVLALAGWLLARAA